jgi:hypothetical protein
MKYSVFILSVFIVNILFSYSLLVNYENFRCAIESQDALPGTRKLNVKILEEAEACKQKSRR